MVDQAFSKQTTQPDLISGLTKSPLPAFIGPYKIESLLNKGGMSLLYLGIHPETKQPIALKVLSPDYVNHPESVKRFLKEAQIIALTCHPNIVKLYGQGEWENGLYIAMEFIRGLSLRLFIMQQTLSMRRALEIILQVSYALLHLHSHGVIHRDLKPENILIDGEGEIKVIDFGIAQLHDEKKTAKTSETYRLIGTPNYMSPEQKENPDQASFASDIYSLGIILYELILGKNSYGMVNLSLLPKALRRIVAKALAVSIQERYQDITSFIHDISQYLTSGEMEKERTGSDQIKEIHELLQKSAQSLSPIAPPRWSQCDLGVAKFRSPHQLGLYYDFFKLPNNTLLILIAATPTLTLDGAVNIGVLRGMVRTLLQNPAKPFKLLSFVDELNRELSHDPIGQEFGMNLLLLEPQTDQLTYISCGLNSLYHLPQGSLIPRKLSCENARLGADATSMFAETKDNWNAGDLLVMHSLCSPAKAIDAKPFEDLLTQAIEENSLLSAQKQSDAVLKKVSSHSHFNLLAFPKALITIQRIM
jgi:serine/threonine protein kinase